MSCPLQCMNTDILMDEAKGLLVVTTHIRVFSDQQRRRKNKGIFGRDDEAAAQNQGSIS